MIKNIIFDVGKVLVDFSIEKVLRTYGVSEEDIQAVSDATVRSDIWNEYDRSSMSDEEILAGMIKNAPEQDENIRLLWEHIGESIECFSYTHEWIEELKNKGYGCYILSNYPTRTYELTKDELSFEKKMDGALYSYQIQKVKPEPEIFQALLERFELKAAECVFLDDNAKNVAAAQKMGIHGIQFISYEQGKAELKKYLESYIDSEL